MIREKRQALILSHLRTNGAASITELAKSLNCSASTLRRDLKQLSDQACLQLTHGGAFMPSGHFANFEPDSALAAEIARDEKRAIGLAAAQHLSDGDRVVFDSSSTVLEAARSAVARALRLTAVTNSLTTGAQLATSPNIEVIIPGGIVRRGSSTLIGWSERGLFSDLHADTLFLGTHTITDTLLTETSVEVAAMKRSMIAAARKVIVLADSTKFQEPALCTICDVTEVDTLITDSAAPPEAVEKLRQIGLEVILVDAASARGR